MTATTDLARTRGPSRSAGLDVFRDPEAVTVVGASADPAKWGAWLARGALCGRHRRAVHLVNRRGDEIAGHPSVRRVEDVDGPLGLVALCVPPAELPGVVRAALDRGARGFLGITAGLDAVHGAGAERALAAEIRRGGGRLVGPSCLGLYDASTDLQLAWGSFTPGPLAIVSQSGQVGSELADLAAASGLGVSRFVSLGRQVDVTAAEVLADLADHDDTRVVAVYLEGFGDGLRLVETLRRLRSAGKPVLLLTVGSSAASRQAAVTHTGALTSATALVDAACRAAGAVRCTTPARLVAAARTMVTVGPARGRRVAVVGDSGGQGALAADVLTASGLRVPPLDGSLRGDLAARLPAGAATANPVDLAGAGEADLSAYADVVEPLLADPRTDAVLLTGYFGSYGRLDPGQQAAESAVARRLAAASARHRTPLVVHAMSRVSATVTELADLGVAVHPTVEDAALGLAAVADLGSLPRPWPVAPTGPQAAVAPGSGYRHAREVLGAAGIVFADAVPIADADALRAAAGRLRAPYVLKADWIAHKTEAGAIAVGLGPDTVAAAYADLRRRLGDGTLVLEEQDTRPDVVEMIVGARRDPVFGPTVMVGTGGVQAELWGDTSLELGPVDLGTARAMVRRLRGHELLTGWRGRPPVDVEGLAALVVTVSLLLDAIPGCTDLELNPVRVGVDGVLAVDALLGFSDEGTR